MANLEQPPEDDRSSRPNSSVDLGMMTLALIFVALATGFGFAASRLTSEPWHIIFRVLTVLAAIYAIYLLAIFGLVVIVRIVSAVARGGSGGFWSRWPPWIWPPIVIISLSWPLLAAASGYSGTQWLIQGLSVYGGIIFVLAVFFRRDRS